jgi:DNA-3-methyladenine glycosylase
VSALRVDTHPATPIATTTTNDFPALPQSFFARPAEVVAPDLVGCLLVKRQRAGELLWGVIVETEAYSQDDPACHGYRRRSPSNETLFGEPGRFYVYVSYGIHHCVNGVSGLARAWQVAVASRASRRQAGSSPAVRANHGCLRQCRPPGQSDGQRGRTQRDQAR